MKPIFLSILFFLFFSVAFAQKLSDKQINIYLNALQKEQIISEYGKDAFLKAINKENQAINQQMADSPLAAFGKIPDSLTKSRTAILGFIGIFELLRNVGSAVDEMIQLREMSEKMLGEQLFFKPELEGEINTKNPVTFLGTNLNISSVKENYLILANRLKAINLIDQRVYDELLIWLKKDQIALIKDFGFFIYAAKQTYFYDNYEALKLQQFDFIDQLQSVNLLNASTVKELKASYKPYELKSKIDILSNSQNIFLIPPEQGNFTREEIYRNLFNEIKSKLIPEFAFSNLKVSEVSKNEVETQFLGIQGLPFASPLSKNKKNYKLTYQVNDLVYSQKADTDFSFIKTLLKNIPSNINIDSSIIKTYGNVISLFTGITGKDFQCINDFLTDKKSIKRLIVVNNDFNPFIAIKDARKILMLVDSTQNVVFGGKIKESILLAPFFGEKTDFSNKFSRDKIRELIEEFQQNDILPDLDKAEIEKIITDFRFEPNNRNNIKKNLLLSFPLVVAKINFFPKKEDKPIAFKAFILKLSNISKGNFMPEKITDNFENESSKGNKKNKILKMGYKLKGTKYETKQEIAKTIIDATNNSKANPKDMVDYFDDIIVREVEWVNLVNHSLEENLIDGQFFKLSSSQNFSLNSNESNYIFLNKRQATFIEKNHTEIFIDKETSKLYNNNEWQVENFNSEKFAEALKKEKMISEDSFKKIDLKTIKEPSEILINSPHAVVIDMNELINKSNTELYGYVINKFGKKLLPEVKFNEIKYLKEDFNDTTDNEFLNQNISAIIDGKAYEQVLNVSLNQIIRKAIDSLKNKTSTYFPSIGENQFKIINDYLTDIASPKRLVVVCDYRSPNLSFILFDSTQATLVAETLPNNYVDFDIYSRQYSRDSLQVTLDEFSRIGLCDKMSDEKKEAFILKFRRKHGNGMLLLESIPTMVVQANIWDVSTYKNVYKNLIDSLMTISKSKFEPTNVSDNFAKNLKKSNYSERNFNYSFNLNNKKYEGNQLVKALPKSKSKKAKISYEVFDFDTVKLLHLINQALIEGNSDYSFYQINSEEEEDSVGPKFVFLNSKQHRWLKSNYPEVFEIYFENRYPDTDELKEEK